MKTVMKGFYRQLRYMQDYINAKYFFNSRNLKEVRVNFLKLYYNAGVPEHRTFWLGRHTLKPPLDLWVYQEIIYETKPDVIIETGTHKGGSALYFASIFDLIGKGRVLSIDIQKYGPLPKHKRITYLTGSATSRKVMDKVKSLIKPGEKVMVSLDDDHTKEHVLTELTLYAPLVSKGCYMVCEDTVLGRFVKPEYNDPGPHPAVMQFLKENSAFRIDKSREKFLLTFHHDGYLKKVK